MSVTVKAFFEVGDGKPEIRRFPLSEAEASNFFVLREKMISLFGKSLEQGFKITWKDDEGDDITVSSNDELKVALQSVKNGTLKLNIRKSITRSQSQESGPEPSQGDVHPNVVCDGCDASIRGFRYKCTQCPDFDLCAGCEARGQHAAHVMIRLPSSSACPGRGWWRFNPRGHHWRRSFRQNQARGCGEGEGSPPGHRHGHHWDHLRGLNEIFGRLWTGLGVPPMYTEEQNQGANAGDAQGQPENAGENPGVTPQDFLSSVGETIAAILDPMGIDVTVDVEHNGERERCHPPAAATATPASEATPATAPPASEATPATAPPVDQTQAEVEPTDATPAPFKSQLQRDGSASPVSNDWAVLDENGMDVDRNVAVTNPASQEDAQPSASTSDVPPQPAHPDPKIAQATELMMSMGFNNEQGWVTRLLELKQGNINEVLDIINVLKNYTGGNMESVPQIVISLLDAHSTDPQQVLSVLQSLKSFV